MNTRPARLGVEITREISDILRNHADDPRVSELISVVRTDVTRDLSLARIYVSVYGGDEEKRRTQAFLRGATGFVRSELARRLKIRHVPEIQFRMDNSIEYSVHISKLIEEVRKEENRVERDE